MYIQYISYSSLSELVSTYAESRISVWVVVPRSSRHCIAVSLRNLILHAKRILKIVVPRQYDFGRSSKGRDRLWPYVKVVSQVDLFGAALLVDSEIAVVSSDVDIRESKFYYQCPHRRWQVADIFEAFLLPAKLRIELYRCECRQFHIDPDPLVAVVWIGVLLLLLHFIDFLEEAEILSFEILKAFLHVWNAIVALCNTFSQFEVALFTGPWSEWACLSVGFVVLLEHFLLTAIVCTFDSGVVALNQMFVHIKIRYHDFTTFVSVHALHFERRKGLEDKRVGFRWLEILCATVRATDVKAAVLKLLDVLLYTNFAEALVALLAFFRVDHHILTEDAVKETIVLNFLLILPESPRYLFFCQGDSSRQKQGFVALLVCQSLVGDLGYGDEHLCLLPTRML